MRLLFHAAACLVLLAACTATSAAPSVPAAVTGVSLDAVEVSPESVVRVVESIQRETYVVGGDTAAAVRVSLNRLGPYAPADGRVYDAITRWGVRWSFRYDTSGGACSLAAATIEIVAVTVLPELADRGRLTVQLLKRWDAYIEALTGHEEDHVDAVRRGVRALQAAFDSAPAMANCTELGAHLTSLGEQYEEAMRAADLAYDAQTGHGRTQGAVFP